MHGGVLRFAVLDDWQESSKNLQTLGLCGFGPDIANAVRSYRESRARFASYTPTSCSCTHGLRTTLTDPS